ncbi:MAG: hypothetical protein G01um101470_39 [Parcubacteria group bacterium Gr01-1014_70]|nr:MAG: hypothetical protein G01um101470_39 [Parcubacteria group bacterium Gr01-1014_70]
MKIESSAFENSNSIPSRFTCDGNDISPPLTIKDVHPDAKSLVLIMDDPDASRGTWIHWVVWNIKPADMNIPEGGVPDGGVEGYTSFGRSGYGGPCPPSGSHRYIFKLYALDTILNIPLTSQASDVVEAMKGHVMADAKLIGVYSRG